MIRLILTPAPKPGYFIARLETGEFVCQSDKPLADGARELIKRGFDPLSLITMRPEGNAHDSFVPHPIGEWAKWTYSESSHKGLRRERYRPRPEGSFPMRGTPP